MLVAPATNTWRLGERCGICARLLTHSTISIAGVAAFFQTPNTGDDAAAMAKAAALAAGMTDEEASAAAEAVANGAISPLVAARFLRQKLDCVATAEQPERIDELLPELQRLLQSAGGLAFVSSCQQLGTWC